MVTPKDTPPFKLPLETRQALDALKPDLEKAEKAMKTLKKLGMDTTDAEDKLNWAKEVRETLLSEFD